jgi:REP element-mobilizing transposase RayT
VGQAADLPDTATEPVTPPVGQAAGLPSPSFYESLRYFNPRAEITDKARNLPHWRQPGVIYFVTFRLADSLPAEKRHELELSLTNADQKNQPCFMPHLEEWLDSGYGECLLRNPAQAKIVADCLRHFDGQRYELLAWVVMPNHVHVLVRSLEGHDIDKVLHTWKSFTAHEINKSLGRSGPLWQRESYDHIVRDPTALWSIAHYIVNNPAKAGYKTRFVDSRVPNT